MDENMDKVNIKKAKTIKQTIVETIEAPRLSDIGISDFVLI